ncbi:hypothetical protein ERO13_A10G116066v2 [Gossypium hirsutum]|nr:hypothetical protein ERO13_A10G116066v2 [Gossypium hirsutum]
MVGRPMGKIPAGYENVIVYRDKYVHFYFYHNKPLYVESTTNGFLIRRTFINDGSSMTLMSLSTLKAINIDVKCLRRPMIISSFDNKDILMLGQVTMNFKIGSIQDQTYFYLIDDDVVYHPLIGRKFLPTHNIIPSFYHQCIKGYLKGKELFIPAIKASFE